MTRRAANPGQRPFMVSGDALKRIAAAVQHYEHGDRRQSPIKFRTPAGDEGGEQLKLCKTTADWDVDTLQTLDVWHDGTPPTESSSSETIADVVNKVAKVLADTFVLIGQAGNGSWYLVEICRDCESGHRAERLAENGLDTDANTDDLEDGDGAQVLLHHNGCLRWVNLTKVTVLTDAYIDEGDLVFSRDEVWVFPDATSEISDLTIEGTDCAAEEPPS